MMLSRRSFAGLSLAPLIGWTFAQIRPAAAAPGMASLDATLAGIEAGSGGRLGVAVLDTADGTTAGRRADERFPMCSTFKLLAASAILAKVDAGTESLTRLIHVEPKDLLSYAPITKQHAGQEMSVGALCEAAVTLSDNTAANLLLASLGGAAAITDFARSLGDKLTRLDRIEPELNESTPGDVRDTTTPAAMAGDIKILVTGTRLSVASRDQLIAWLVGCKTGDAKLRAGLPKGWRVGDKTGAGGHGSNNDAAVIWPTGRPPVIVTSYLTETNAAPSARDATHAAVGRAVAAIFAK